MYYLRTVTLLLFVSDCQELSFMMLLHALTVLIAIFIVYVATHAALSIKRKNISSCPYVFCLNVKLINSLQNITIC